MQKNQLQLEASDPNQSVWVSASAGTGKTKILTDRVLRLLLSGAQFNKILCLTFTNAATSEMEERINVKLKQWSASSKENLFLELELLLGREPRNEEYIRAKKLYIDYLNSLENKISIYTIHSFCQKILKKFPLEAGISSSFQILEQLNLQQLINKICNKILNKNEISNEFLITNFHTMTLEKIFHQIIDHKLKFKKYFLGERFNFQKAIQKEESNKKILLIWANQVILEINHYLKQIEINELIEQKLQTIKSLCEESITQNNLNQWFSYFLTKDWEIRKKLLNSKVISLYPDLAEMIYKLQKYLYKIKENEQIIKIYIYSFHLLEVAKFFIEEYDAEKRKLNYLDFDDLIFYTSKLLSSVGSRDWVLYKLDGGIEHILIDESQDTSLDQWEIIKNLIEEFYVGEGAVKQNRTIFVVGDEKQSIFSFQGADLEAFYSNKKFFNQKLINIGKQLKSITLEQSYRSLTAILEVVHNVFDNIKNNLPNLFFAENNKILPARNIYSGRVEIWPVIAEKTQDSLFWPTNYPNLNDSATELACKIAHYIKNIILSREILPSTNKPVEYKDILIIVRKRDDLIKKIIEQLKQNDLPNTGMDRIVLNNSLSVLDLISIAKFVLNPYDDLNLAEILKSPIFNLTDRELENIILSNNDTSLYDKIKKYDEISSVLEEFCFVYQITDASNFFHYVLDFLGYRKLLHDSENNHVQVINELLWMSFNYAKNVSSSLLSFIFWFEENDSEIKCEVACANKIRIMTAHNSKGLQSPIVILCDTIKMPSTNQENFFWHSEQQVYASAHGANNSEFFSKIKKSIENKQVAEYLRLLYVALTRAEDILVICGQDSSSKKIQENCWFSLVKQGLHNLTTIEQEGNIIFQIKDLKNNVVEESLSNKIANNELTATNENVFQFSTNKIGILNLFNKKLENKSKFEPNKEYFTYGKILHKIFEDSIKSKKILMITKHPLIKNLPNKWLEKLSSVLEVLSKDNLFSNLSQYDIKTELSIGLTKGKNIEIYRVDLMIITETKVFIIDYKSDYHASLDVNRYANLYIKQLSSYYSVIKDLYPNHQIICKILWLSTAEIFTVENNLEML